MSSPAVRPSTEATSAGALKVGRGALHITAAKGWFMVTGAVVNFALGTLLGAAEYGNYGVTVRWVSLLNMMVVQGLLQGMSRAVARDPSAAGTLWRSARGTALAVGVVAACAVVLLAEPLAGFLGDPALVPGLRIAAVITGSYALYSAQVGVLNGLQLFGRQAWLDMAFSTSKMAFILGAAALGLGAAGSVGGFGLAAVLLTAVTAWALRDAPRGTPSSPLTARELLGFSGLVMAYQALLNLLMFVDLGLVKRAAGAGAAEMAGHYAAAVNLAQLPYLGCTAVTFVVFPLMGREPSVEDARRTSRQALRYALLIGGPVAAAMMACGSGVLGAVFPAPFRAASSALSILCVAYLCAALLSVAAVMLNAMGRPAHSTGCVLAGVLVSAVTGWFLVPSMGMEGAAVGSLLGMGLALVLALRLLHGTGRAEVPWGSLARHGAVVGVALLASRVLPWPDGGMALRVAGVLGAGTAVLVALAALVLMGEVGRAEWDLLMKLAGRKAKPA